MKSKIKLQALSKKSKDLLNHGESETVDFKRSPEGVTCDDLVAFANTISGGDILIGITEKTDRNGVQIGIVTGCDVSDSTILQIVNKAISCIPPVKITTFIENIRSKPIIRVHVPSSDTKPHSTPKGIYCRRDGSRNRPLHPTELLKIFLENEGRAFAERFEQSVSTITDELTNLEANLSSSIENMSSQLGWTDMQLGDTESTLSSIQSYIRHISKESNDTSARLRTLFRQDKRDDPVKNEVREKFKADTRKYFEEDPQLFKNLLKAKSYEYTVNGRAAVELTKEETQEVMAQVIADMIEEQNKKNAKKEKQSKKPKHDKKKSK